MYEILICHGVSDDLIALIELQSPGEAVADRLSEILAFVCIFYETGFDAPWWSLLWVEKYARSCVKVFK